MFSQTAEYALRAMTCLALHSKQRTSSGALVEMTQAPSDYLAKVLQQLARADLVEGRRGVRGGYRLARPANEIRMIDVVNAVEPLQRIKSCPLGIASHGPNLCPLHRKMDQAAAVLIETLGDSTLEDLISDPKSSTPLCSEDRRPPGVGRASLTIGGGASANGKGDAGA